jgi:hypothetical protein
VYPKRLQKHNAAFFLLSGVSKFCLDMAIAF